MKILFIGWNENGEKCLTKLLQHKHTIVQVIAPASYAVEPMKRICEKAKLPYMEYGKADADFKSLILKKNPDLIIVASYPTLLPLEILKLPKYGVINVHTGELPKYRGFHPLNWALIRDETKIGVTVHYMDEGMDTGNILAQGTIDVTNYDDINTIKEKITTVGARLLVKVADQIRKNRKRIIGREQQDSNALFAPKRKPSDGKIKWTNSTREVFNLVRSLKKPYPEAFAENKSGDQIFFEKSYVSKNPGEVIAKIRNHYLIATGDGVILLKTNQPLEKGDILK